MVMLDSKKVCIQLHSAMHHIYNAAKLCLSELQMFWGRQWQQMQLPIWQHSGLAFVASVIKPHLASNSSPVASETFSDSASCLRRQTPPALQVAVGTPPEGSWVAMVS